MSFLAPLETESHDIAPAEHRRVRAGSRVDPSAPADDFDRDPVRVLFVWDHLGYPNGATHGLTRYCVNVLPRLNTGPVRLTACFLREEHRAGEELSRQGVEPIFLGRSKWDPRALVDVHRVIRQHDIEVVHAVGQKGILAGRTAARLAGCGVIVHLRDLFPLNPLLHLVFRAGAAWTDVAQGNSRAVCRYATTKYGIPPERVELLYNGVDFDQFPPVAPGEARAWRAAMGIAPTTPLIGVVGRLAPEKGHARLLRQMRRVLARLPDARLLVVGDGPLRGELRALSARLGLSDAVRFLGQRDDVRTLMGALDVLAVPSDHEGFSFVTLEALMVGTPVVGTDVGALPEVLDNGAFGMLFSPAAEDSLGDGLLRVLKDPEAARGRVRRAEHHLQRFAMDKHVQRQREIYLRLAAVVRRRHAARRS